MSDPKRALQASSIVLERSNTNDFCASPKPFPVDTHVEVYWPGPDLSGIWSRGRVVGASWSPDEKQKFCYDISVQSSGNLDEFLQLHRDVLKGVESSEAITIATSVFIGGWS